MAPRAAKNSDIAFGWELAKEMGRLDVGQSVAVKERAVLAVEAIEGTDRAIARAGELCRAAASSSSRSPSRSRTCASTCRPSAAPPSRSMHQAGGRVLAIEAGKTIVIDEAETVALADRYGITIVAR